MDKIHLSPKKSLKSLEINFFPPIERLFQGTIDDKICWDTLLSVTFLTS